MLKSDTYAKGQGSRWRGSIDGTMHDHTLTAIAGVANIGSDTNWTGSHFNQANWYAFGRMAWNPDASAQDVADEWIRQTFSQRPASSSAPVTQMMMSSRQNLVNYMEPLGLVHMMGTDHHYGPAPWVNDLSPPTGTRPTITGGRHRDRVRSHVDRQQHRRAVRADGGDRFADPQHDARRLPAVLPAR